MSHEYKFYIQRVEFDANSGSYISINSTTIDLESHYAGLKYSKLTGTNDKGKTKNIYTEKYADGDRLRVYVPELAQYEATTMTLTLYFFGEDRQQVFNEFANEIKTGIHRYWDTARHQYFDFFVDDELKTSDESWYSGQPYFKVDVKMKNLYGECRLRKGVNLLTDGDKVLEVSTYLLGKYTIGNLKPTNGEKVRITFKGYMGEGRTVFHIFNSSYTIQMADITYQNAYDTVNKMYKYEFKWKSGDDTELWIFQAPNDSNLTSKSRISDARLEII